MCESLRFSRELASNRSNAATDKIAFFPGHGRRGVASANGAF